MVDGVTHHGRGKLALSALLAGLGAVLVAVAVLATMLGAPKQRTAGTPSGSDAAGGTPAAHTAGHTPRTVTTRAPPTTSTAPPVSDFPSSANTGWKHTGVTLRSQRGDLTITRAGTVIDGRDISGCVSVRAANVTIKRSRIRCDSYFPLEVADTGSVLVVDTEIDGMGSSEGMCLAGPNYTARRVDCHHVGDGMRLGSNVLVEDSFIHDLVTCDDCHNDAMQATGAVNVVVRHNTIENRFGQTAAIMLGNEFGPLRDVLIERNLLSGGGFTLYGGGSDSDVSDIRVIDNRFRRTFFPNGGSYGPVAYFDTGRPGNVWSGNVWDDTGKTIAPVRE